VSEYLLPYAARVIEEHSNFRQISPLRKTATDSSTVSGHIPLNASEQGAGS
jgi:hypothetical protein